MATHDAGTTLDRLYRNVTTPVGVFLAKYGWITPNRVSVAAFVAGGVVTPIAILSMPLWVAAVAFAVSDLLDYVDGDVARAQDRMSREGDILDGILDRYTDFFAISAMIYLLISAAPGSASVLGGHYFGAPGDVLLIGLAALLGSMLPAYVQAVTVANGKRTVQSIGGRGTRNRVLIAGLALNQPLWTLIVLAVLGNLGTLHRVKRSLDVVPGKASGS